MFRKHFYIYFHVLSSLPDFTFVQCVCVYFVPWIDMMKEWTSEIEIEKIKELEFFVHVMPEVISNGPTNVNS